MITGLGGSPYPSSTSGFLDVNFNFLGEVAPDQEIVARAQAGEGQAQLGITLSGTAEILEGIDFTQGLGNPGQSNESNRKATKQSKKSRV